MKTNCLLKNPLNNHIRKLSNSNKGPFFLYNSAEIRKKCRKFLEIPYSPKSIHYAMMANSNHQFLQIIKEEGLNIFVNSIMHMEIAVDMGYKGEEIIFAASAMNEDMMRKVKLCGAIINLDSTGQLELWNRLFPNTSVGIRCNIGELVVPRKTLAGYFVGKESRLGLTLEEIKSIKGNPFIEGLHLYAGTNIIDLDYFFDCYYHITRLVEFFPSLRYLDFGGGFGLGEVSPEEFDMESYSIEISDLMNRVSNKIGYPVNLILEPGRIIGGNSGYFICEVIDIKSRGTHQLIGVNASCVQFPRPLFYPESAFHPVSILHRTSTNKNNSKLTSSIFGCSTYSRDFLAQNVLLPKTSVGDLVVFGYAGSYCSAAHTNFLGFPKASEYFL